LADEAIRRPPIAARATALYTPGMGSVNETIKTFNSAMRTLLATVVVVGAGYVGYIGYALYNKPQQELAAKQAELTTALAHLEQASADLAARDRQILALNDRLDRVELAMQLLKVRRRLGRLTVLDQHDDPALGMPVSRIEFVEINDEGQPIGPAKQFDIQGDIVYVDYLNVTFDDKYVEQSDLDRSTSICLFQRIFGEHQQAAEGYQLDEVGTRPTAYARGTAMSDFEKKIWGDFWLIANDPQRAAELGIYAAHGAAVYQRVQPGATYELELRSSGGLTIRPVSVEQDATESTE
jgi:hypothetical protein